MTINRNKNQTKTNQKQMATNSGEDIRKGEH